MKNFNFVGSVNVVAVVNSIRRGCRGMNVVAVVSCDKKLDKAYKNMIGRIHKVCMWNDRPLVSYSGNVNAKADLDFTPQPRKGFTWIEYPYFEKYNCDKGDYQEYYLIDNKIVDKDTAKAYFKPQKVYAPKAQIAVGVTNDKDFSKVVRYEIEKILYIGQSKDDAIKTFNSYR